MLGFANAVKSYGDHWMNAFQSNSTPRRVAAGESARGPRRPDQNDYILMRCCVVAGSSEYASSLPAQFSGKGRA